VPVVVQPPQFRLNPVLLESPFDNLVLDMPDKDRLITDSEGTRRLARCRAQTSCYFRKVIRRMQQPARLLPMPHKNQFIEIGNEIAERTARSVAEWYPAIHASSCLLSSFTRRQGQIQLIEVANTFFNRTIADGLALIF